MNNLSKCKECDGSGIGKDDTGFSIKGPCNYCKGRGFRNFYKSVNVIKTEEDKNGKPRERL